MTRISTGRFAAAAAAMLLMAAAVLASQAGQPQPGQAAAPGLTPVQIPPAAQQYLASAIDALNGVDASALRGEAANGVAAVRRDFDRMRAALSNPALNGDWRTAYSAIERDLSALLKPAAAPQPGAAQPSAVLDSVTRGGLELFQTNLALFQQSMSAAAANPSAPGTGTPAQPEVTNPPPQAKNPVNISGAGALLNRIDDIVSAALENKPTPQADTAVGTTGALPGVDKKSRAGKVTVDRAALDEILAEVRQLKVMLSVHQ